MAADRAINMALRVLGIGEVERDFRRVGDAGNKSFAEVKKATNGAALEVSDYTERLKRAAATMRQMAANTPALSKGTPDQIRANRRDFILGGVQAEQERILKGLPDATAGLEQGAVAAGRFGASLTGLTAIGGGVALTLGSIALAVEQSLMTFAEHEKALAAFNATLALSGNRSTATAAEIRTMATQIAAATGQTEASTLQAATSLAKIPGMTKEGLQSALDAAARLAATLGTDVASVIDQQVSPVFQALADRDMKALIDATKDLNDGLRDQILTLAAAGQTAAAQRVYLQALREATGAGSGGLTGAANELSAAWTRLKTSVGEQFAGPAEAGMKLLAHALDGVRWAADTAALRYASLVGLLGNPITIPAGLLMLMKGQKRDPRATEDPADSGQWGGAAFVRQMALKGDQQSAAHVRQIEDQYGDTKKGGRGRAGRGRSAADTLQREADQARAAADRIDQANKDVITSWAQRTADIEAKAGLEGDALKAVEQQQEVEAAVRRINTGLIEREVEARQKAAAAAHQQFDAAKATAEATAEVNRQSAAVRDLAERYVAAQQAMAEFDQRQAEAKSILEGLKTPMEKINDEVEQAIELLRNHALTADQFNGRMKQLAEDMARAAIQADSSKRLWVGLGDAVGRTLTDIVLHGGSAIDVLQKLIELPLERLLFKNVEQPIAKAVDSLFGVNVDKNAANIQQGWPSGKQVLGAGASVLDGVGGADTAASLMAVSTAGTSAAQALERIAVTLGEPVTTLGSQTDQAGQAMGKLVPLTGQFGGALGQAIAMLSSAGGGGGGGGGILGSVLSIGGALLGGGISAGTVARLAPSASATIAANPALFASGTDDLPVGRPFWVGENGRELMERTRGGNLRVHSNQQAHHMLEGGSTGMTLVQHINIPERADPRRTAGGIARATQGSIARAARKGLATAGSF